MNLNLLRIYFPNISTILWKGNCFHGLEALQLLSARKNCSPADCSSALLWLSSKGYISHNKFRPTHSQAAFMGLEGNIHKHDASKAPNVGNASAFDWTVLKEIPQ